MGIRKPIKLPEECEELGEFIGIILGDGHLSRKQVEIVLENPAEQHFAIRCSLLAKELFGLTSTIKINSNDNSLKLRVNSLSLVEFLLSKGLFVGDKIKNDVCIPKFVLDNNALLTSCIRGLIDTDGGIFSKDKKGNRAIIEFENKTVQLRKDFKTGLEKLGFTPSKSGGISNSIRIQKQDEVRRFIKEIGFNNPKNLLKSQIFLETGLIPSTKEVKSLIAKEAPMIQPG
ncbi:MAG: hypothetical protein HYW22_00170 [Candidatus Aenigmarchaeota archaeon]|nr:hypothetical protein [Candidatus Aenigmarchaeota archaeon]